MCPIAIVLKCPTILTNSRPTWSQIWMSRWDQIGPHGSLNVVDISSNLAKVFKTPLASSWG
jgi:hypothetical protein